MVKFEFLKRFTEKSKKLEEGQGLVEYALILFLVAVVVIAILILLGPQIGSVFKCRHQRTERADTRTIELLSSLSISFPI